MFLTDISRLHNDVNAVSDDRHCIIYCKLMSFRDNVECKSVMRIQKLNISILVRFNS